MSSYVDGVVSTFIILEESLIFLQSDYPLTQVQLSIDVRDLYKNAIKCSFLVPWLIDRFLFR